MELARRGVPVLSGVSYQRIDEQGLHILHEGQAKLLEVDHVVVCAGQEPVNALRADLERALARRDAAPRVIVFGCDCAADTRSVTGPGVTVLSLLCIGMLPPSFIEYALRSGADGVLVTGCREADCAYRYGNVWTEQRLNRRREPHLRPNVPHERLRVAGFGAGEETALAHALAQFRAALVTLPARVADGRIYAEWRKRDTNWWFLPTAAPRSPPAG